MKIAILSAIVTGAVALNPADQFHWKRNNATMIPNSASGGSTGTGAVLPGASATPDLTTIVIATTLIETMTKCKPTVTACPVGSDVSSLPPDAVYIEYSTSTVILATTVCPVSEVEQVSSSVISSVSQVNIGVPTDREITTTQPFSPIGTNNGGIGNGGGGTTEGNMGNGGDSTTDATTTTTRTTRATSTVTITRVPSGSSGFGSGSGSGSGSDVGNGSPECTPVTVFVKIPETVYVTVVPDTGLPPPASTVVNSSPGTSNPPAGNGVVPVVPPDSEDEDDCPVEEEPSSTSDIIIEVTATVVPFPANGTMTKNPSPVGSNSVIPSNAFSRFGRRSPHHF